MFYDLTNKLATFLTYRGRGAAYHKFVAGPLLTYRGAAYHNVWPASLRCNLLRLLPTEGSSYYRGAAYQQLVAGLPAMTVHFNQDQMIIYAILTN